jgi:hypothetical protein
MTSLGLSLVITGLLFYNICSLRSSGINCAQQRVISSKKKEILHNNVSYIVYRSDAPGISSADYKGHIAKDRGIT